MAPATAQTPARLAATAALAALLGLALLDLATRAALGRAFNPALDLPLVADAWRLASGALGAPLALAAATALVAGLAAAVAALWWATGAVARTRPARALPALALLAGVALAAGPSGAVSAARLGWEHLRDGWRARGDLARFRADAATDRRAEAVAAAILPALQGHDVLVVFVESYGRSALENPLYAPQVTATLAAAEPRLAAAGLAARSAWLTSPVSGGQSWLAHATLLAGLEVGTQGRYRALLASPRRTLLHLARRAGWRTAAVMPAITLPWPEAAWFGYDTVLAAADLGYAGRPFNWVTMPDQFTLAAIERRLLAPAPRPPVFAAVALISSHAPWTPIPPLLPWDAIGDGAAFDRYAAAGDAPEVVWRDPDRVRTQYRAAIRYALDAVLAFAARRGGAAPVLIVLGDHQPAAFVAGDAPNRDVPVHVIAPPALLAPLARRGWTAGLVPGRAAPVVPMQDVRDLLLDAFGAPGAVRPAAPG